MDDNDRYIRFELVAKKLLRDKANYAVFEGLISVFMHREVKIQEILENAGTRVKEDSEPDRIDMVAKDSDGELLIIEIRLSRRLCDLERIFFDLGKTLSEYGANGGICQKVKNVYSISLLYFDLGQGDDYVYHGQTIFQGRQTGHEFQLCGRDRDFLKTGFTEEILWEYYLIRVNEFDKVAESPLDEWVHYLKTGHVHPDTTTPGLKEIRERLGYTQMSPEERRDYQRYLANLL